MVLGSSIVYSLRVLPDHINQPLRGEPAGRDGIGEVHLSDLPSPVKAGGFSHRIALSIGIKGPGHTAGPGHGGVAAA